MAALKVVMFLVMCLVICLLVRKIENQKKTAGWFLMEDELMVGGRTH